MRTCLTILTIGFLAATIHAQDIPPPIEWGKIDPHEVGMTTFSADTAATAVILCDYGESFINNDLNVEYHHHKRIRILSEAGYAWGSYAVTTYEEKDRESVSDIEGVTYTRNADGTIARHSLSEDAIFKEAVTNGYVRHRFTLPALVPGCVVEFRYRIIRQDWYMRSWTFQTTEPVLWSEYRVRNPLQISYCMVNQGYESFDIHERTEETVIIADALSRYLQSPSGRFEYWRWVLAKAPAVRTEPYITTMNDYVNRVTVQLAGYALRDGGVKRILNDWQKLVNEYATSKDFGDRIDVTSAVRKKAETLTASITSPLEQVRAIYNWVDTACVFTGTGLYMETDVNDVLDRKKGSGVELVLLLTSLLRARGFEADPVIYSTRTHGEIIQLYPLFSQFNAVLARVKLGSMILHLQPTDPFRPMELLPPDALNTRGLVIHPETVQWIPLESDRRNVRRIQGTLRISEEGTTDGWLEGQYEDYAALAIRRLVAEKSERAAAQEFFGLQENEMTIDSIRIDNLRTITEPVRMRVHISAVSGTTLVGDHIYVTPRFFNRLRENSLRLEKRKFPVDFAYPSQSTAVVKIIPPPGFTVADTLPPITSQTTRGDAYFSRRVQFDSTGVQFSWRFDIRRSKFEPSQYRELKDLFGVAVNAERDQFTLEKRPAPAQLPPAPARPSKTKTAKRTTR